MNFENCDVKNAELAHKSAQNIFFGKFAKLASEFFD